MDADGLIWWSTPRATCGLIVVGGTVVDCPPYAAKAFGAMGRDARDVWREQVRAGADLEWLPDPEQKTVEHHWNGSWGTGTRRHLWLRSNGLTWQLRVQHGRREGTFSYRSEADARRQLALLLSDRGPWKQLPTGL